MTTMNSAVPEFDVEKEQELISERIVHALEIFPFLSLSGLHQQVGTATPRGLWQPVLLSLVDKGRVTKTEVLAQTPTKRNQVYTLFHLAARQYTPYNDNITIQPQTTN